MGQQQLLLLVLAAIIVGTGVILGVNMFQENAAQANMDAVTQDCLTFASKAQAWSKRPASIGGGGHAFTGFDFGDINLPTGATFSNENGDFTISGVTITGCVITGVGKENIDGAGANLTAVVTVSTNNVVVTQTK